jgi:hypothetical protein
VLAQSVQDIGGAGEAVLVGLVVGDAVDHL